MDIKPSKFFILGEIKKHLSARPHDHILDLGSGQSLNWLSVFERFPNLNYVGLEPNIEEAKSAQSNLSPYPNARIINRLDYELFEDLSEQFDVVVSLSVLEHVKNLRRFLKLSVEAAKPGGRIIHLYDLGHSLYPTSYKERAQVFLCNNRFTAFLIPKLKFTAYVHLEKVKKYLLEEGVKIERVTYHNMPNHVTLLKQIDYDDSLLSQIANLEVAMAGQLESLSIREKLFPSICLWAVKSGARG